MSALSMNKFCAGLFAAIVAAAPLSSQAQDPGMFARVNVPFSFETGAKHFAAGVYTIRMENEHSLLIRGVSDSGLALTSIEDAGSVAKTGKAVFQRYGNRYFLREVSVAGKSRRLYPRPTKEQSQLENASKRTTPAPEQIALSTER
jgi:hypothetical protein